MTMFDDQRQAAEARFVLDEETAFRITARRNRLVGNWAAGLMQLTPEEADDYARAVVHAEFEEAGDADVVRKLVADLTAAGVDIDEARVRQALDAQMVEARRQLMESR